MNDLTVSERLIAFARQQQAQGLPDRVLHEAQRLLLNQLKASVGAGDHPAVIALHDWATGQGPGPAHALWLGTALAPAQAAVVNGALFEVLDFHDTYIPTYMHAVSAVLPAVLAAAEVQPCSGAEVLSALALGLEIELAVATILMPSGYYRGHVPAGLVGGVGAAAACSILAGLNDTQMRNALGLAMCSAFGCYESVGSGALAYITGMTARSGYTAFELAQRGLDAPRTAFEGEKGMFASHCDEPRDKIASVLDALGASDRPWRLFGQSYKTVPTETITHAPVELVLQLLPRAKGRTVERLTFGVEPIVVKIADERRERFGAPKSELEARFDLRHCAAAAWRRGRFTLAEMKAPAYTDPAILDLRARIELVADEARKTFEGAWLEVRYSDGSSDRAVVEQFLGTPGNPMSDEQLGALFLASCEGLLPPARSQAVLQAVWSLDRAASVAPLMALCKL